MPILKSAKKKLRQDVKRRAQNVVVLGRVKEAIKEFKEKKDPKLVPALYQVIDTAAKKHLFHQNKAARLKSRLARLVPA